MYLSFIPTLVIAFFLQTTQIKFEQLVGTWQLVHFDAMDELKKSPQYLGADSAMRAGLDYKIKNRLENTVYIFVAGDSLKYTDYVNRDIVQIKAKIEISPNNVLTIKTGSGTKQAKVLELGTDRMILEPISTNPGTGKLVFERVK
jgi:hypothetical protein